MASFFITPFYLSKSSNNNYKKEYVYIGLGNALVKKGFYDESIVEYMKVLDTNPNSFEALITLAKFYY